MANLIAIKLMINNIKVSESDNLIALRVERDEKIEQAMSELQDKITSSSSTSEEKNTWDLTEQVILQEKKVSRETTIWNMAKAQQYIGFLK